MPNSSDENINFIPSERLKKDENSKITKQLLHWTVSAGMKIIILTQIIVIIAIFVSYKLDNDLANISTEVKANQEVISDSRAFEAKHAELVQDIKTLNEISNNEIDWKARLEDLNSKIPQNMTLKSINYGLNNLELNATVRSAEGFGLFLQTLLIDENVESISLNSSSYDTAEDYYKIGMLIIFKDVNK